MNKNLTELVFILDRSGSMGGLEGDTIGGFNSMLEKQRKEEGEAVVTTVLFDDRYELLHDRIGITGVKPITGKEYYVRGTTALLDAIGKTINKVSNAQKNTAEDERADKVLFAITTDGMENASSEFSYSVVRKMIEYQKAEYKWEFIFMGANIDAITEAEKFGIGANRAVNFVQDSKGLGMQYKSMESAISSFRQCGEVAEEWKAEVEADYKKRGTKTSGIRHKGK